MARENNPDNFNVIPAEITGLLEFSVSCVSIDKCP